MESNINFEKINSDKTQSDEIEICGYMIKILLKLSKIFEKIQFSKKVDRSLLCVIE